MRRGVEQRPSRLSAAEELVAFHDTALALIQHLDVDSVLQAIVERAGRLVGVEHGVVYVVEPGDTKLTLRVATGLMAPKVGLRLGRNEGVAGCVWATGEPLAVADYPTWWARNGRGIEAFPFHAVCGVPLVTATGPQGVFGLAYEEEGRTFGPEEIELLTRFGHLASIALENARLFSASQDELRERRRTEDELVDTIVRLRRSESEVQRAHEEMIRRLAHAAEFRNSETGQHVDRMSRYCTLLAERVGLDEGRCELIRIASALHDVGKIAIPDSILLKPAPLDSAERQIMRRHAEIGHRLLSGSRSELLEVAALIAHTHHERYDGRGYPRGLAGGEIPLEGRIASIADVFDALTSERVYRSALSVDDAVSILRDGRGTHFDPFVLDLFLELLDVPGFPATTRRRPVPVESERIGWMGRGDEKVPLGVIEDACASAGAVLAEIVDDRQAIDTALDHLYEVSGRVLLPSVFLVEHDRLWMISQRGYDEEVRDGFSLEQGVIGRAARTARPQHVRDVREDDDYVAATETIRSEIAVPLGGRAEGALNVETQFAELPDAAVPLFYDLGEALAPRVAAIGAELTFDLSRLTRLCVFASSLRGVGSIAEFSARVLGRLLGLESAQISLATTDGHRLASFWRLPASELRPLEPAAVERVGKLASMVGTAFGMIEASRAGIHDDGPSWLVWLPLQAAGAEVGALVGRATAPPALDLERAEGATLFAQHAAALIDVAAALRREQRAAVTDPLTGLLNRRGFEDRLDEEIGRARRSGQPVALVLLDCDDLKEINDRGGHADGDAALRRVAESLRSTKRSSDVVARVGGDEFTLILPETDAAAALEAVDRIRDRIRRDAEDAGLPITVTCGIAAFPADGDSSSDVIRTADRLLYAAKLDGRDCVLVNLSLVAGLATEAGPAAVS